MGIILEKYRIGINLGGWISQCSYKKEHIAEFITKADIERIASWGLDHVRLPFDYPILECDSNPFCYMEEGFEVIDRLIGWCKDANLNVVLDMHKAPGYAFLNKPEDNILFTDETSQKRYYSLWQEFARRYKNEGDNLIFELLNEIIDPHGDTWNMIARKAIEAIWEIDSNRYILLGGPNNNFASGLDSLEFWDNERVLYTFHFYDPLVFTHQRASWTPLKHVDVQQPYPGKMEGGEKLKAMFGNPDKRPEHSKSLTADTIFNKEFLENSLAPAIAFAKRTSKELYCGEYGAISNADINSRINYIHDMSSLLEKHGMGKACWTYKAMEFPMVDENGKLVSDELLKALTLKKTFIKSS